MDNIFNFSSRGLYKELDVKEPAFFDHFRPLHGYPTFLGRLEIFFTSIGRLS